MQLDIDVPITRSDRDGLVDEFRRRAHWHDREQGLIPLLPKELGVVHGPCIGTLYIAPDRADSCTFFRGSIARR
jgi:hypothetical protein